MYKAAIRSFTNNLFMNLHFDVVLHSQLNRTCMECIKISNKPVAHTESIVPSSCSCTVLLTVGSLDDPSTPGIPCGFFISETSKKNFFLVWVHWLQNYTHSLRVINNLNEPTV